MPSSTPNRRVWHVVVKAHRNEMLECVLQVVADSKSDAEALALTEGRKLLRQGGEPPGLRTQGPWHVVDAIPSPVPDGPTGQR